MDIWIVEYRYSENGFWKHYCDVEFSQQRHALDCAKNVINKNPHLHDVRISRIESEPFGDGRYKTLECSHVYKIIEPQKVNWKEEGF